MNTYQFSWAVIQNHLPELFNGLIITLEISFVGMIWAVIVGLVLVTMRLSQYRLFTSISYGITQVFRSIPLFVLLFWVYYGLSLKFNIRFIDFQAGAIALGVTGGAYMAEVFRGGLNAIDAGQREAALAIGLSRGIATRLIVFPQAIRIILPQTVNVYVGLLKGATIVSVIGVADMIYVAQYVSLQEFRPFELYTFAGIVFICLTLSIASFAWLLERKLSKGGTHV
jgi:His/Glu/Gln/Arg/opine family amino acid ABC transporter permease subunit